MVIDKNKPIKTPKIKKSPKDGKKWIGSNNAESILYKLIRATPELKISLKIILERFFDGDRLLHSV